MTRFPQPGKKTLIGLFLGLIAFIGIYQSWYLTREPGADKDCDPLIRTGDYERALPDDSRLEWVQRGGVIDDASCLDETPVAGIVAIHDVEDVREALSYARENDLKVSMAGAKHSMGGHAFSPGGLVLDMTSYKAVTLDEASMTMRVESGATWHDIQKVLHPKFAVKAMQSTDIFTVGGSISVNAHGMDHQAGAVENSLVSFRIMLPDGSIQTVSRTQNPELYRLAVGGYGLFGVILDAEIQIVPNDVYESSRQIIDYTEFPALFADQIAPNEDIGLMYTHLSTAPGNSFLKEAIVYKYTKTDESVTPEELPPLGEVGSVKLRRFVMNVSKYGGIFQTLKWWSEKYLEPKMESCTISRAQAQGMGEACLVSRNEPMHDSVPYLKNSLKRETDILHEYFIPRENLVSFIDGMRDIMREHDVTLLNASVRVVNKERAFLSYAPEEAFSIVLYINQATDAKGNERMAAATRALIDLSTREGGRFFLPYQLHYTREELKEAYPEIDAFFAKKKQYDPTELLTNTWYEKYKS